MIWKCEETGRAIDFEPTVANYQAKKGAFLKFAFVTQDGLSPFKANARMLDESGDPHPNHPSHPDYVAEEGE